MKATGRHKIAFFVNANEFFFVFWPFLERSPNISVETMYATPSKTLPGGPSLNDSVSTDGSELATPVKSGVSLFGAARKATPTKPSPSADYKCFVKIAKEEWTYERSGELATMLMAQVSADRDINAQRRSNGDCALYTVVATSPPFVVQAFLNHGANPSLKNHAGRSVLHAAVRNPNYKVARMVWRQISQTLPALLTEADSKGLTPMHEAAMSNNIDVMGYMLDAYLVALEKQEQENSGKKIRDLKELVDAHQRNLLHSLFESRWTLASFDKLNMVVAKLIEMGVDRFGKDDRHRTPLKSLILKSVVVVPDSIKRLNSSSSISSSTPSSSSSLKLLSSSTPLASKTPRKESSSQTPSSSSSSSSSHIPSIHIDPSTPQTPSSNAHLLQSLQTTPSSGDVNSSIQSEDFSGTEIDENPISVARTLLEGLGPKEVDRNLMLMFKNDIGEQWQDSWRPLQQAMQIAEYFPFLPLFATLCSIESLMCVPQTGRSVWHYLANMGAQPSVLESFAAHFGEKGTPRASVDPESGVTIPQAPPHVLYIRKMVYDTFDALLTREDAEQIKNLNPFDLNRQSPLHAAATYNNTAALQRIFEAFGEESQAWSDLDGLTPLHYSVKFDTVLSLLSMHAMNWNLDPVDSKGRTPYALAIELRRGKATQLLRFWGANLGGQDNASSVSDLNFDISEESLATSSSSITSTDAETSSSTNATDGSNKIRMSLSLSSLPAMTEVDILSPSGSRIDVALSEEDELEEDDEDDAVQAPLGEEAGFDAISGIVGNSNSSNNRSTAALVSAIQRAKVRDQEAEEELKQLTQQLDEARQKLDQIEGENAELEKALNSRPTIQEFTETQARIAKLHASNDTLKATVQSLRQHVAEQGLKIEEQGLKIEASRSRSSSPAPKNSSDISPNNSSRRNSVSSSAPLSPISDSDYQQSFQDYEDHIGLLKSQLQESRKNAIEASEASDKRNADMLQQLRRQLDDTQARLSMEEQKRLEKEEKLIEKENDLRKLRAEQEALVQSLETSQDSLNLNSEIQLIEGQLKETNAVLEENRSSLRSAESRIADLMNEVNHLKSLLEEKKNEIERLSSSLRDAQEEMKTKTESQPTQTRDDELNTALMQRLEDAELNQEQMRRENAALQTEVESRKRENEMLAKAVETLDMATKHLKDEDEERKMVLENLQRQIEDNRREASKIRENQNLQTQTLLRNAKTQMQSLEDAIKSIHEKVEKEEQDEEQKRENDEIASKNSEENSKNSEEDSKNNQTIENLKSQQESLKADLSESEKLHAELKHQISLLEAQLESSKKETEILKNSLKSMEQANEAIAQGESERKRATDLLSTTIDMNKDEITFLRKENEDLKSQLEKASSSQKATPLPTQEPQNYTSHSDDYVKSLVRELETAKEALEIERKSKETQIAKDAELRASLERAVGESKASAVSLSSQLEQARKSIAEKATALEKSNENISSSKASLAESKGQIKELQNTIDLLKSEASRQQSKQGEESELKEIKILKEKTDAILAQIGTLGELSKSNKTGDDKKSITEVREALDALRLEMKKKNDSHAPAPSKAAQASVPATQTGLSAIPTNVYAALGVIAFLAFAIFALQILSLSPGDQASFHYS